MLDHVFHTDIFPLSAKSVCTVCYMYSPIYFNTHTGCPQTQVTIDIISLKETEIKAILNTFIINETGR